MKLKGVLFQDQHKCFLDDGAEQRKKLSFVLFLNALRSSILPSPWNWRTRAHYHTPRSLHQEKMRQIHRYRRTIHPFSLFSVFRESVIFISLLFKLFTNDFGYIIIDDSLNCGGNLCEDLYIGFTYVTLYMNVMFLFFTGYVEKNTKHVQLDNKKVAVKYLRGNFLLDVITSFPYLLLWKFLERRVTQTTYLWLHFSSRIVLLFNIIRLYTNFHSLGQTFGVSKRLRSVVWSLLFLTILTCAVNPFLYIISKNIVEYYRNPQPTDEITMNMFDLFLSAPSLESLPKRKIANRKFKLLGYKKLFNCIITMQRIESLFYKDKPTSLIYEQADFIKGFFQSLISLGQRGNRTIQEFNLISMLKIFLVAINLFGYILLLANIIIAYQNWWSMKLKYYEWFYKIRGFIKRNKVGKKQAKNLHKTYEAKYFNDYHWDRRILHLLGDSIIKTIETERCRKFFGKQPLIRYLSEEEMQLVGSLIEEESYLKNEVVFQIDAPGDIMFYLSSGRAIAITNDGSIASEFGTGDYFGEVALIASESKRQAKVVTTDMCYFWVLSKYNFNFVLNMIRHPLDSRSDYFISRNDFTTAAID